jgi:light-regulated signal transduction histidine kinase (bacteriophytochrome)
LRRWRKTSSSTLECHCLADDDRIQGDADRLQQVVWNLLNNAVKFTPKGGRIRSPSRPHGLERPAARDRQRPRHLARTFCPTSSTASARRMHQARAAHGGLGIGLTIVRHIVELHHGTVHAESAGEGQGATFYRRRCPAMASATVPGGDERMDAPAAAAAGAKHA